LPASPASSSGECCAGSEAREAEGNVLLLAIAFAVVSLLTLEFILPPLEKLLGLI